MPSVGTPAKVSADAVEVMGSWAVKAKVAQDVVEVLTGIGTYTTPTGSFGVAVSQRVVEVLTTFDPGTAKVGQDVVEVLMAGDGFVKASPGVFSYGHIG